MSFGISLKRERELRGITLDEISKTTKISVRLLQAIESDRFDVLPEGVFRKSFIRSYANYLGMDEEQVLQEYALEVQPSPASLAADVESSAGWKSAFTAGRRRWLLVAGILVLLGAAGYRFWHSKQLESRAVEQQARLPAPASQAPSEAALPAASAIPPASSAGEAAPRPSAEPNPATLKVLGELAKKPDPTSPAGAAGSLPLELKMEASNTVWVSVSGGESLLYSGMMNASDSKTFSLEAPLKVVVGNAGGIQLSVNGQLFSSLGKTGERRTFEVSATNYSQYLAPKTP
ncbi:MAG: helix-turn-helix domain-containing protein [Acidimicrobiia bacterium]|nr:helix-turn-helix domain-containing protein [Acidimicrobiia bacterium]